MCQAQDAVMHDRKQAAHERFKDLSLDVGHTKSGVLIVRCKLLQPDKQRRVNTLARAYVCLLFP